MTDQNLLSQANALYICLQAEIVPWAMQKQKQTNAEPGPRRLTRPKRTAAFKA